MTARERVEDGLHILELSGEIDLACSGELRELLLAHAKAKHPALLLDFTSVEYIDSSGLATLVEYVRESDDFGGKFGLCGVQGRVKTILDLVRLGEVFGIHATIADARAAFAA